MIIFSACSRSGVTIDDDNGGGGTDPHIYLPGDTTAPVLEIYTPTNLQVFTSGSSINVTGKISDDIGLYRGTIRIVNESNGFILVNQPYEIHGVRTYLYNLSHTASVGTVTDYRVTVSFEDHGLNSATKTVYVKVNP